MSANSRSTGLLRMLLGAGTFAGTSAQVLPAVAFFPGPAICLLGVVVFVKASCRSSKG
jgi:hypothetical protein